MQVAPSFAPEAILLPPRFQTFTWIFHQQFTVLSKSADFWPERCRHQRRPLGRRLEAGEDLLGPGSCGTHAKTRLGRGATLFASEKLDHAPSWEKLASGTLAIAHRDLRLELYHL
jgi:hypothetical protein